MKSQKFIPLLVVVTGPLAYQNSFTGAFVYDDAKSIIENPTIRFLWPIWRCLSPPHRGGLTGEGRPLINLSLAIGLGFLTGRRNQDYRSEVAFWSDLAAKSPSNPQTYYNLRIALERTGRESEAIARYEQVVRITPDFAEAQRALARLRAAR
ncbi:MAG TPA: tetratricopeptide repeat protein [Verrucomicrobiae bacterium]|nr:tetratricopeptide repeat protein [Verrucomicrobiae bacterium]